MIMAGFVLLMVSSPSRQATRDEIIDQISTLPKGVQAVALQEAELTLGLGLLDRRKLREIVDIYGKVALQRGIK